MKNRVYIFDTTLRDGEQSPGCSMTVDEKENPKILNRSRIQRVARGSGTDEREVKELIKQYNNMRKMLKKMKGSRRMRRQIPIKFS